MSEERKVMCPWCRSEMRLWEDGAMAWYTCHNCGAETPTVVSDTDDTPKETLRKMAYAAATATPPNRPLTEEQVEDMPDLAAVWEVKHYDDSVWLRTAKYMTSMRPWATEALFFAAPPTPADIEAARKEHTNGTC